ncbi:spermidine/putrescine ABC transporter permease [Clostridia bacterium]|nr:spermidine/putrescine ABC transporter permease [Clostridia bacterium]
MRILKRCYILLMLLFLYAPIFVLMVFSFNSSRSRGRWGGFTTDWYAALWSDREIKQALITTLLIAVISAVVACIAGTAAALGINSFGKVQKRAVLAVNNLPVLNPDIVTGVSLMILFQFFFRIIGGGSMGFVTLLLAHITFNIPYVILSVLPKLRQLDKNMYEAALDLGATAPRAFFKVILPEISGGIISGFILAFTLSIDDFVISFFTTGQGVSNLSIMIYGMARRGINPKINALSTIIFIVVMVLLYLVNKINKEKDAK